MKYFIAKYRQIKKKKKKSLVSATKYFILKHGQIGKKKKFLAMKYFVAKYDLIIIKN